MTYTYKHTAIVPTDLHFQKVKSQPEVTETSTITGLTVGILKVLLSIRRHLVK